MSQFWFGRSSGLTAKELDGEIEKISRERGLLNEGDDGISEASSEHGVVGHLRHILHSDSRPADPPEPEGSEEAAWQRERVRQRERD